MNPLLTKILGGGLKNAFTGISDLIQNFKIAPEKAAEFEIEKQKLLAEVQKYQLDHEAKIISMTLEENKAYIADVQNARAMQIEALQQDDKFSKRFVYYLTLGLILLTFIYDFLFFFITYPKENHDIINMIAGVVNSVCLASIINFFYGSSKGARDNFDKLTKNAIDNGYRAN